MNFEKKEFGKTNSALYDSQDIIVLSNNRNIKLINDHEKNNMEEEKFPRQILCEERINDLNDEISEFHKTTNQNYNFSSGNKLSEDKVIMFSPQTNIKRIKDIRQSPDHTIKQSHYNMTTTESVSTGIKITQNMPLIHLSSIKKFDNNLKNLLKSSNSISKFNSSDINSVQVDQTPSTDKSCDIKFANRSSGRDKIGNIERIEIKAITNNSNNNTINKIKVCKICYESDDFTNNRLINPCLCQGSMKYIHEECLKKWIENNTEMITAQCEICKHNYRMRFFLKYKFSTHRCCRTLKNVFAILIISSVILSLVFSVIYIILGSVLHISDGERNIIINVFIMSFFFIDCIICLYVSLKNWRNNFFDRYLDKWTIAEYEKKSGKNYSYSGKNEDLYKSLKSIMKNDEYSIVE